MRLTRSITQCFKKYFDFSGRASRSEFWWFFGFSIVVLISANILDFILFQTSGFPLRSDPTFIGTLIASLGLSGGVFTKIVNIVFYVPVLAVSVRRLHDIDKSGAWYIALWCMSIGSYFVHDYVKPQGETTGMVYAGYMVLFVGFALTVLYWQCKQGSSGANRFDNTPDDWDMQDRRNVLPAT